MCRRPAQPALAARARGALRRVRGALPRLGVPARPDARPGAAALLMHARHSILCLYAFANPAIHCALRLRHGGGERGVPSLSRDRRCTCMHACMATGPSPQRLRRCTDASGRVPVQPFIVAGTVAAAALLVVVSSPALLQGTPGAASHLALLPVAWVFCFAIALVLQARTPTPPLPLHTFPASPCLMHMLWLQRDVVTPFALPHRACVMGFADQLPVRLSGLVLCLLPVSKQLLATVYHRSTEARFSAISLSAQNALAHD